MKTISKLIFAVLMLAGVSRSYAAVETRNVGSFSSIEASGSFDVYITQTGTESVKVDAPADMMEKIKTEVSGGVLKLYTKGSWKDWSFFGDHKKVVIYVTAKQLNGVGLTGSGDVVLKNTINSESFKARISGSGDFTGSVNTKELEVGISGSGDMRLSGKANTSAVRLSGSGDYDGKNLVTASTSVHISGSGDASINASNSVDASVSGSGDVRYTGGATNVHSSSSGSGDVRRM
ncbi:DUF2807 domain-containing protein [Mucilaginibacter sp. RS28]|uniref:DUF2807 domain-containing protein n=1 Tax=Mucilaginibacter straminoryzae TaxID=2932774 RepID=A0A9X2BEP7_9SPHI|nr:head GIN domain-containing protein [Mucilaginibacter straminoryzae]MCJ8211623.1 DUF2807 domain-containing protein [Mucilaginibacter straminoryzae]